MECLVYAICSLGLVIILAVIFMCVRCSRLARRYWIDFGVPILIVLTVGLFTYFLCKWLGIGNGEWLRFMGTISAVLLGLVVYRAQKRVLSIQIVKRVSSELEEIYRHLGENINVINSIDLSKGVPSQLHIRKLEIAQYSLLSDEETLRNLDKDDNKLIFQMMVKVRNYNINVEIVNEYVKSEKHKLEIFQNHKKGLLDVTKSLQEEIKECSSAMELNIELSNVETRDRDIIYEKEWN